MDFGDVIKGIKNKKVARRKGWNGKNMHLYLKSFPNHDPFICMFTAQGTHQPGWLASQADMLAEDWEFIE